jgi:glycogen debranching enzyme
MAVATIQTSEGESQFRIEATGAFREPRTRILKHGDTFAVLNHFGDIAGDRGSPDGLYHHDTRHLSQLELYLNGDRPLLLSANPGEDNALLTVDLANPDMTDLDGGALHRERIYINRRQFVWENAYNELVLVRNFDVEPHVITLSLRFAADFVDCSRYAASTAQNAGGAPPSAYRTRRWCCAIGGSTASSATRICGSSRRLRALIRVARNLF